MINESRIKLMTRLAAYESSEGKKNMSIGTYFRGDYISGQIMKSIIYGTVAFALVFVLYLLYDAEKLMESIYEIDLMGFGKELLIRYLVFIGIY